MKRWPVKPLREIAECLDGRRVPITAEVRTKGDVPYYGANGQVGWIDKPIFNEPLLLIAEDGGHFDQPEKGVAYMISGPSWVNNHAHVIRSDASKVRLEFLGHYFRHFNFMPFVTGTTRAKLNQKVLMSVPIPVPPLAEQERIVKLLDEADELRKLRAQADRRSAALIPALFHEMFGDPITNSRGWSTHPVSSFVAELQGGHSVNPAGADEATGRFRVLKISAVTWGEFQPDESKPVPAVYEPPASHLVRAGDLLFSRANTTELVAATSYVFDTPPNLLLPDKLWRFVWKEPRTIEPLFVWWLFQAASVRRELGARATGTGGSMKNISKPKVMTLEVPVPPLPLQQEFAQRVSEIRALQAAQAASRKQTEHLFQSMLQRAFNQALVREGA